jgi:hypothetical protein
MLTMFIRGFDAETNNIKCEIENENEVFDVIKGYAKYSDVLKEEELPKFRIYIFKLMNGNKITNNVKNSLEKILKFTIKVQSEKQGIYWY